MKCTLCQYILAYTVCSQILINNVISPERFYNIDNPYLWLEQNTNIKMIKYIYLLMSKHKFITMQIYIYI